MKNCLVTKFRVDTQNPNLKYFDALQLKVDWDLYGADYVICFQNLSPEQGGPTYVLGGIGCTVKILSNGTIGTSSSHTASEYTFTGTESVRVSIYPIDPSENTELLVIGLNNITGVGLSQGNGVYMKYPLDQMLCSNLGLYFDILMNYKPYKDGDEVDMSEYYKNFSPKENVTQIRQSATDTGWQSYCTTESLQGYVNLTVINWYLNIKYGNIAYLSGLTELTQLNLRSAGVYGNIASLGNCTKLVLINFNDSSISGSIEDFVNAQYNASTPRKSASGSTRVRMYFNTSTNITFGGVETTSSGKYLAWDDGGSAPTNIRFENS